MKFFVLFILLVGVSEAIEQDRKIEAHLYLEDFQNAVYLAKDAYLLNPESSRLKYLYSQALLQNSEEDKALTILPKEYHESLNPFIEEISWAILKNGVISSQYGIKAAAVIGAFLCQDARAIENILALMQDSNALVRLLAIQLASSYRDEIFHDKVVQALIEEKDFEVRLGLLQAIGQMKMKNSSSYLQEILTKKSATNEEKTVAIKALVNLQDKVDFVRVKPFLNSDLSTLRRLGIDLCLHFEVLEAKKHIIALLDDPISDVRLSALQAFAFYYTDHTKEKVLLLKNLANDVSPIVAITASWALMQVDQKVAEQKIIPWLLHTKKEFSHMAAAAIAAAGKNGASLAKKYLDKSVDPYIKINLALGLVGQRAHIKLCCDTIYRFLQDQKDLIEMVEPFSTLTISDAKPTVYFPNYRQAVDQMTRLHLLSLLAILKDKRAKPLIKKFLQNTNWKVTGAASVFLLEEGDEEALNIVRTFLQDDDDNLKIQSALILAFLAKDPQMTEILQSFYPQVNYDKKIQILEALGSIGGRSNISFLYERLFESSQKTRLVAASSIIRCLNH